MALQHGWGLFGVDALDSGVSDQHTVDFRSTAFASVDPCWVGSRSSSGNDALGGLGWRGWLAVVLYLAAGSLVTRIGFRDKQRRGLAEARGGQRGPANVWGSAATGAAVALLIGAGLQPEPVLLAGFCASLQPSWPIPSAVKSGNAGEASLD